MKRLVLALAALLAVPAAAQQDTTRCATVTVSKATGADQLALIADAECFGKAGVSALNSQGLRLAKAKELAAQAHQHPPAGPAGDWTKIPDPIPSNFNVKAELVPAWGTGELPPTGAPDDVGAFRFLCNAAHVSYDDPIVYPGEPGASHLHQWFGNTAADAFSTYESLRTTGESTCMSPLNRSAYWMPAMKPGTSFHSDWFGAWDDPTMATWMEHCIDKLLSCAGGVLGDGTQMKANGIAPGPRLVPVPAR